MAKYLLLASALAGSASAFTPAALSQQKTALFSDVGVAEPVTVVEEIPEAPEPEATKPEGFCQGMVGGEGPEPVIFSTQFSSVDFDPAGFAEVNTQYRNSAIFYRWIDRSVCETRFLF